MLLPRGRQPTIAVAEQLCWLPPPRLVERNKRIGLKLNRWMCCVDLSSRSEFRISQMTGNSQNQNIEMKVMVIDQGMISDLNVTRAESREISGHLAADYDALSNSCILIILGISA